MTDEKKSKLREVLEVLDPSDDAHWTKDGLPNLNVVQELLQAKTTRAEVTKMFPQFTRESLELETPEEADPWEEIEGDSEGEPLQEAEGGSEGEPEKVEKSEKVEKVEKSEKAEDVDKADKPAEDVDKALEDARTEVREASAVVNKAREVLLAKQRRYDELLKLKERKSSPRGDAAVIQEYQRSELRKRQLRAQQIKKAQEALGGLPVPDPVAPVDNRPKKRTGGR